MGQSGRMVSLSYIDLELGGGTTCTHARERFGFENTRQFAIPNTKCEIYVTRHIKV